MNLTDKRKEVSSEKSKIYRSQKKFEKLFQIAEDMAALKECENTYHRITSYNVCYTKLLRNGVNIQVK